MHHGAAWGQTQIPGRARFRAGLGPGPGRPPSGISGSDGPSAEGVQRIGRESSQRTEGTAWKPAEQRQMLPAGCCFSHAIRAKTLLR